MPSNSYIKFLNLIRDVDELIDAYEVLKDANRKNLGCISRSGILMLCASWEFYIEELLLESIDYLNNKSLDIGELPTEVKKQIGIRIRKEKNEIKPLELAESGWRVIWRAYAKIDTEILNTPNQEKLDNLYKKHLGISKVSDFWNTYEPEEINEFIRTRGKIAHKGRSVRGVQIITLRNYFDMIKSTAIDVDSNIALELKRIGNFINLLWDRTYL